jgi:hypothetical protein
MDHLPPECKKRRADSFSEPRRCKDTTPPSLRKIQPVSTRVEISPERPLTLQLYLVCMLDPTRLRITDMIARNRATRYRTNDHFHGRLPVNTSHSKPRVLTNSHLCQAVIIAKRTLCRKNRSAHIDAAKQMDNSDKVV